MGLHPGSQSGHIYPANIPPLLYVGATPNIDEELERVATFRPQGMKKRAPTRKPRAMNAKL